MPRSSDIKTEADLDVAINKDLEIAADEAFGSEDEVALAAETAAAEAEAGEGEIKEEASDGTPGDEEEDSGDEDDETKAAASEDKVDGDKPGEKKDEEEDPYAIPADIKGRTRDRMEKLTGDLKTAHAAIEEKTELLKTVAATFEKSGLNPQEIQSTLTLGTMLKTDPAKAHQTLTTILGKLSEQLGVVPPGADPLEGFEELKQRVMDREITQADAEIIAGAQRKTTAETTRQAREQQRQQQEQEQQLRTAQTQEQRQAAVSAGEKAVATFLTTAERDPDYDLIKPMLIDAATFAGQNLAPEKWAGYISSEFKKIKDIHSKASGYSRELPLTDQGTGRAGAKSPKTLEDLANTML